MFEFSIDVQIRLTAMPTLAVMQLVAEKQITLAQTRDEQPKNNK